MPRFTLRRLGLAAAAASATLVAGPGASAAPIGGIEYFNDGVYECTLPGLEPESSTVRSSSSSGAGQLLGSPFPFGAGMTVRIPNIEAELRSFGATAATVSGSWPLRLVSPSGTASTSTAVSAPETYNLGAAPFPSFFARVPAPSSPLIDQPGSWSLQLGAAFTLDFEGTNDAGETADLAPEDDTTTTASVTCTGSGFEIAQASAFGDKIPAAPLVTLGEITQTSARLRIEPQLEPVAPQAYRVYDDAGREVASAPGDATSILIEGLTPTSSYRFRVRAFAFGRVSPLSEVVSFTVPAPNRTVQLAATGTIALRTPISGGAAIKGRLTGTVREPSGSFTGQATFEPTTATFKAYGVIPLRATLAFTPSGEATGQEATTGFTVTTKQDVAIKSAYFAGIRIATGTCHTAVAPTITLRNTTTLDLTAGGAATASFTLGRLTGCSALGSLVGTSGGATALAVKFTPTALGNN